MNMTPICAPWTSGQHWSVQVIRNAPSLAVRHYPGRRRLAFAYLVGVGGDTSALVLSILLDLPSGALIVWCLALLAMAVYAAGPTPPAEAASAA